MSTAPPVTVLMPVHNGLPFLREAVDSILAQTFRDFDLLIIDDASTDASPECLKAYGDPRMRVVRNERNLGQTATLNRGLALARGRYVARIDQDDVSLPARLEKQVEFLDRSPETAVVGTWGYAIDARGRRVGASRRRIDNYGHFVGWLSMGACPLWHPSVMFRRDVVEKAQGYDPSFAPAEDYDLWVRLAMERHSARVVPEPLIHYRLHDGQQTVTRGAVQLRNIQRAHDRFVRAFCPAEEAERVGMLLRIEDRFWSQCRSRDELNRVLEAAEVMFREIGRALELSPLEVRSLRRAVARRVGPGIRVGASITRWPSFLFYPVLFALSPLLVPGARRSLAPVARWLRALPYRIGARS